MLYGRGRVQWRDGFVHLDSIFVQEKQARDREILAEFYRGGKKLRVQGGDYRVEPSRPRKNS